MPRFHEYLNLFDSLNVKYGFLLREMKNNGEIL